MSELHASPITATARATAPIRFAELHGLHTFMAEGLDASSFLHSQLTNDVQGLDAANARLAGYCTAKGRLLATMIVWRGASEAGVPQIYGVMRASLAELVTKRLSMFVLRAKVKLLAPPLSVFGVSSDAPALDALGAAAGGRLPTAPWHRIDLPTGTWITMPAAPGMGRWLLLTTPEQRQKNDISFNTSMSMSDEQAWRCADIVQGLPWIEALTQDMFIPQTINFDLINGVSFTKGCYPGQEIVARSHYLGKVKRRMAFGTLRGPALDVDLLPGTDIFQSARPDDPCGRVINAAAHEGELHVLFETTLAAVDQGDLHVGQADGPRLTLTPLPYAIG